MIAAVSVGCSKYVDDRIANLLYAHQDAVKFLDRLLDVTDMVREHAVLLWDGADEPSMTPSRGNILTALSRLPDQLGGPPDTLFFFFSGHGFHSDDGSDYLLTSDSLSASLEANALRFELLLKMLRRTEARHIILFLDACRAVVAGGKAAGDDIAGPDITALCPPGMVSFCSCEPDAVSYEADEIGAGLFTAAICDALDDAGRCVTVEDLDKYLVESVPALSRRSGKPLQHAHTRVEPLSVKALELVSPKVRNRWRADARIGREIRSLRIASEPIGAGEDPILAVDLGTSYSAAALCTTEGDLVSVPAGTDGVMVPSVISFDAEMDYRVGLGAIDMEIHNPGRTIRAVKRHLGTGHTFRVGDASLPAELIAASIIRSLRDNATEAVASQVRRCITAYPANFDIPQINALQRCFELAGLEVERMIGEPNIAAMAISREMPDLDGEVLVVDLGGGTFDVALCDIGERVVELRSVGGSNELGGLDYDEAIVGLLRRRLLEEEPWLVLNEARESALRQEAERAKRILTKHEEAVVVLADLETPGGLLDLSVSVTRAQVREAAAHLDEQVRRIVEQVLNWEYSIPKMRNPGVAQPQLVALTGQGAKIFSVREQLDAVLARAGIQPTYFERAQELAVVRGLAIQAGVLTGLVEDTLLLDLSHRGISIRSSAIEPIDERDRAVSDTFVLMEWLTTIPTKRTTPFRVRDEGVPCGFDVLQRSHTSDEEVLIGTVSLPAILEGRTLDFVLDIDANGTIDLTVLDSVGKWRRVYQLNHHYRSRLTNTSGDVESQRLLELDWALYPTVNLGGSSEAEDLARPPIEREKLSHPDESAREAP